MAPTIFVCKPYCARTSATVAGERGSFTTVTGCVELLPETVSRRVYTPGGTSGPSGDGGVSPGLALISNAWVNTGGASARRSQFVRLPPASAGSWNGGAIQKFGSGGRAASFTGSTGPLVMCRTTVPAASRTSSVIAPAGFDARDRKSTRLNSSHV